MNLRCKSFTFSIKSSVNAAAFLLFLGIILSSVQSFGTHAAGAELTYKCLGGLNYEIEATFYRDCGGTPEPGNLTVSYKSASNSYSRTSIANKAAINNGIEITMPCATSPSSCNGGVSTGLKKWIYRATVTLPYPASDWVFSYRVCCRNCTITTISSPCAISSELYVEAELNNILAPGNSSPQFNGVPVSFVCLGQNFNYNSAVFDLDGDSLSYELIKPKTSATNEVSWVSPASTQQPLNSSTPFTINQLTGDINFTPSSLQIGIIAVKIKEYRNSQLIGSTIRDMQVYTQNCFNTIPYASGINGSNNFMLNACAGTSSCFTIETTDADSVQVVSVISNNLPNGASITQTAGSRPTLTFCWTPTVADIDRNPRIFTVTVRDNACPQNGVQTFSYSIVVNGSEINVTSTNPTCNNLNNGTATVSGQNMQGASIFWNTTPPQISPTASGLAPGTYSVTMTDQMGCTTTSQATIQPSANSISASASGSGLITCQSGNIGHGQVTVTGGVTPLTYNWSNGSSTSTVSNLSAGIHSVTVSDSMGCSAFDTLSIPQSPSNLNTNVSIVSNVTCFGGSNGVVQASVTGGMAPYTFQWNNGATGSSVVNLIVGTYTVTVTDAGGCSKMVSTSVLQPSVALSANINQINHVSCFNGNNGYLAVSVNGGTGPYFYNWSNGASSSQIQSLPSGVYSAIITDSVGCTITFSETIQQPSDSISINTTSVQHITCNGGNSGQIIANINGGTNPYLFSWNNNATSSTLSGLTAGTYVLTVTDQNGCIGNLSVDISEPEYPVTVTASNISHVVCGQGAGSISIFATGGTGQLRYLWSNGETTPGIQNLTAGFYTVTVADSVNCTVSSTFEIKNSGTSLNIAASAIQHVLCYNMSNGSIGLSIAGSTGPLTYLWNNGATSAQIQNLTVGIYSVTVTDSVGCSGSNSFVISQPSAPLIPILSTPSPISCFGQTTGEISVQVTGGTSPYNYYWNTGSSMQNLNNIGVGIYTLTVTDVNGCNAIISTEIIGPSTGLTGSVTLINQVACYNGSNGSAIMNSNGGTGAVNYLWSNGTTNQILSGVQAGTYTVTVSDNSGCSYTESINVTQPLSSVSLTGNSTNANCLAGIGGSIEIDPSGGTTPYSYLWNNGATSQNITNSNSGIYTIVLTDANACTVSNTYTIGNNSQLQISTDGSATICAGDMVTLIADSSINGTFQWFFDGNPLNGANGNTFFTPAGGNYSVSVTNSCGTFHSDTLKVVVKSMANVSVSNQQIICPPETAMLQATGGSSYLWTPTSYITFTNVPDPIVSPQTTTVYAVEITSDFGCKTTLSTTVAVVCDSLFVPTGFSPNDDGVNDGYVIDGIENYPGNKIWVYNRYGKLVFKATDYANDWNGISNISGLFMNKKVGNGTYFYILDLNDRSKPRAGYLIIRH